MIGVTVTTSEEGISRPESCHFDDPSRSNLP